MCAAAVFAVLLMPAIAQARPGDLDRSFGDHGKVVPWQPTDVTSADIGDKGRIVVSGAYGRDFLVARLRRDGDLDSSFGDDGVSRITVAGPLEVAASTSVAIGSVVVPAWCAMRTGWPAESSSLASGQAVTSTAASARTGWSPSTGRSTRTRRWPSTATIESSWRQALAGTGTSRTAPSASHGSIRTGASIPDSGRTA
jgi:hypothetical protein